MDFEKTIKTYLKDGIDARAAVDAGEVNEVSDIIYKAIKSGHKLIVFGNGGSAADAQHFVGEFIGKFYKVRKPMPAIALTTNTTNITAVANDYDFADVFSRQLEGLGQKGDVAIAISTSGNSKNILKAIRTAKELGIYTIGLTGGNGGKLKEEADRTIVVKSDNTPIIQEVHTAIYHMLSMLVEEKIFK